MPSINDNVDYSILFSGTQNPGERDRLIKKGKSGKKKKAKPSNRHPLNVRIDDNLRKAFIDACRDAKTPQYIYLEKALRRILRAMKKASSHFDGKR